MATLSESVKRYRLNVPKEDMAVQQWLDAQVNQSMSIRALIREDISRNGYTDITCRDINIRKGAGRPTVDAQAKQVEDELARLEAKRNELLKRQSEAVRDAPVQPSYREPDYGNQPARGGVEGASGMDDVLGSLL